MVLIFISFTAKLQLDMISLMKTHPVLALVGPTACGKTTLAVSLSKIIPRLEVINVDAVQVFRGMDIGTAKPSKSQRLKLPHHLVDVLDPINEKPSAGWFARLARTLIAEIQQRSGVPFLVGGSGLYLTATLQGIAEMPEIPSQIRDVLKRELAEKGLNALRIELAQVDPIAAARIAPRDAQRTLRALEVWRSSGITLTDWQQNSTMVPLQAVIAGLEPTREALYAQIDDRLDNMFNRGLEAEVRWLLDNGADIEGPALGALGYRHMALYILGVWSREQALRQAKLDTRHYAKRQLTYLHGIEHIRWWSIRPEETHKQVFEMASWFRSEAHIA